VTTNGDFTVYWRSLGERTWRFLRDVHDLRQASDVMKQHCQSLRQLLRTWTR
jgi:hypothetical protein